MVQALIEERFHLKLRRENKELPTYELLVSNGGPKIQRSDDQTPPIPAQPTNGPVAPTGRQGAGPPTPRRGTLSMFYTPFSSTLQGRAVPLSYFAGGLALQLRRAVVDKTKLNGLYDSSCNGRQIRLCWERHRREHTQLVLPDPLSLPQYKNNSA
jgi:uncharacterized protein (TIGR03435 family)